MRKKLLFSFKDPWVIGHKCMGKGEIHYIEVATDSVDSEEEEHDNGSTSSKEESACNVPFQIGAPERRLNSLNRPIRL